MLLTLGSVLHGQVLPTTPNAGAPKSDSADPLNRTTPQSSVLAFLRAARSQDFGRAIEYLDLDQIPSTVRANRGAAVASELGKLLDQAPDFEISSLSNDPAGNLNDNLPANRELLYTPRGFQVEMERRKEGDHSVWVFTPATVEGVWKSIGAPDSSFEAQLPRWIVRWTLFGFPLWRLVALALAIPVAMLISGLITKVGVRLSQPLCHRLNPRGVCNVDLLAGPIRMLIGLAVFRTALAWVPLSALSRFYLERGVNLAAVLASAWLGSRLLDILITRFRVAYGGRHTSFSQSVLPLLSRIAKGLLLIILITLTLASWGFNMTTALAGVGIGGIAVALAAQKTIENLFGGIAIITDAPVAVGDFCKFGDRVGTVEDIGLRSTQVRTLDRTVVTIPNAEFSSMTLENFSRRDKVWFHPILNLRKDTSPEQLRRIVDGVREILRSHPKVELGSIPVRFVGTGNYSLDIEIFAYVQTANFDEYLKIQQELLLPIMETILAAGTALALPAQTIVAVSPAGPQNIAVQPAENRRAASS